MTPEVTDALYELVRTARTVVDNHAPQTPDMEALEAAVEKIDDLCGTAFAASGEGK